MYRKVKSSRLSSARSLHLELIVLHMWKKEKGSYSIQTSFVIITVSTKNKRTYSDVWDNLTHSSAPVVIKLLASSSNSSGTRAVDSDTEAPLLLSSTFLDVV